MNKGKLLRQLFAGAVILALILTVLPFSTTSAIDESKQKSLLPPIDNPVKGNPKLESALNQLFNTAKTKGLLAAVNFAEQRNIDLVDSRVRVVIDAIHGEVDAAREAAIALGAEVEASYENLIRVTIPVSALTELANNQSVRFVRQPWKSEPQVISEGMSVINADDWQSVGYNGSGVKVGILDIGFYGYSSLLGTELPSSVTAQSFSIGGIEGFSDHGTACAEIIYDIAPGADLYLTNYYDEVDWGNAVDWLISQDVDVISCSISWLIAGPGDGTGLICDTVEDARNAGILWVNSAGNYAQMHWMGNWKDTNSNSWINFDPLPEWELIPIYVDRSAAIAYGKPIVVTLKWDDPWGSSSNDYNLYLNYWNGSAWTYIDGSTNTQNGTQDPTEVIGISPQYIPATGWYGIAVKRYHANGAAKFHILSPYWNIGGNDPSLFPLRIAADSLSQPADSLAVMTVGAVPWYSPGILETFSSQGPTDDGRTKPDLVAPDYVSTASYGLSGFSGTSASAPHVAGAAALVKQSRPSYTPAQIQAVLEGSAVDLGAPGKDNLYGAGRLNLQLSPSVTTNAATNITINSATLNGNLESMGFAANVAVSLEWGNTTAYGNETPAQALTAPGAFNSNLIDLKPKRLPITSGPRQ